MSMKVLPIGRPRGFTLIELLVSVAIFTTVMVISLGSLLSLSEANRKAELLSSATNNFNSAIDSMSRAIRTGTNYHCGNGTLTAPADCAAVGSTMFAFLPAGCSTPLTCTEVFKLDTSSCANGLGCISRSTDSGSSYVSITSPEIVVTSLKFFVIGAPNGDSLQPKTTILISGYVVLKGIQQSLFNVQTSVTQRVYDL